MSARVEAPRTLDEALEALARAGAGAQLLAGGTDLMVEFENGRTRAGAVISLWGVDELRGIAAQAEGVRVGALTTCAELLASPLAREHADLLCQAAAECGAAQIQARATLGGNLGTASPAADLVPALMALDARVRLVSTRGVRELAMEEAVTGYRATARDPDELFHSFLLPRRVAGERRAFRKVGTRAAQSISKVVLALCVTRDEAGVVVAARGAAGSVAPCTQLLPRLAEELVGAALDPERIERAARRAALEDVTPVDDLRSTARYRRLVVRNVLRSMLAGFVEPEPAPSQGAR